MCFMFWKFGNLLWKSFGDIIIIVFRNPIEGWPPCSAFMKELYNRALFSQALEIKGNFCDTAS